MMDQGFTNPGQQVTMVPKNHAVTHIIFENYYFYSWFQTFAVFWILYAFFQVIPQRLNFICRHFRTLCLFHLHRQIGMKDPSHLSAYEDGTDRVFRTIGI